MERGEVWEAALPSGAGREQAGTRPAVVLQDAVYGRLSPLVLIVPLTSQVGATRFPTTVKIGPDQANGLTAESVAMVFQTRALDRSRFVRRLGVLREDDLQALLDELARLTGCAGSETA